MKAKLLNAINKQTGELRGNPHLRYYGAFFGITAFAVEQAAKED